MNEFSMTITGDREVLRMFAELPTAAQNRVLKPLLREAGEQVAAAERSEAPKQSGLLQTAIGVSTLKSYPSGVLFIAAGVRRGFRRKVKASRRGRIRYLGKRASADHSELSTQNPVKYLHLVTGGRKAVSANNAKVLYDLRTDRFLGKKAAAVAPNPFVDRAFDRAKNEVIAKISGEAPDLIMAEAAALLGH